MKMNIAISSLAVLAITLSSWTSTAEAHGLSRKNSSHKRMVHEKRQQFSGQATFYNTETGNAGSCGKMLSNSGYTVAVNKPQYNQAWCGKTITISANGKTHTATIQDECPGDGTTCKWGALDMSPALFNYFSDPSAGVFDMSWSIGGSIVDNVVSSVTGHKSNNDDNNNNNNNNNNSDNDDEEQKAKEKAEEKKKAAASKAAAEASRSSASAAAYASSTAAAAAASESRASASSAAHASATSAAAASSSSVSAASSRSEASESKASVASVHRSKASVASVSKASVASVSRASVASVSRVSVSAEKAAKSSSSAAAASASAEAARPKNIENFDALFGGLQQLAMAAQA
ncbi:unnamed protein product [Sympodiomycopsis kandeliae]